MARRNSNNSVLGNNNASNNTFTVKQFSTVEMVEWDRKNSLPKGKDYFNVTLGNGNSSAIRENDLTVISVNLQGAMQHKYYKKVYNPVIRVVEVAKIGENQFKTVRVVKDWTSPNPNKCIVNVYNEQGELVSIHNSVNNVDVNDIF